MAALPLFFDTQFYTDAGAPAASYLLYTYSSGTSTPKATYTDSGGLTANANPVVLNSAGRCTIWLASGLYSMELKTPAGVLVKRWDGVGSVADITSSAVAWSQAGSGATSRFVESKLREIVDLADYGAVMDGTTDDSDAMDAAIAYAVTKSVAGVTSAIGIKIRGDIKLTRSHVISDDYIVIYGGGRFTSTVVVSSAFRVFDFKKGDSSTIYYGGIANLGIRASSAANLASGAFIRFYNTSGGFVDNVHLQGWYVGIEMTGAARTYINKVSCSQAQRTSGQGLAGISIGGDATAGVSTGNHITDYECYSTAGFASPFIHGILVTGSDGLYINQAHMTEGENDLTIAPDNTSNNDLISSVQVTNTYLDACTSHSLWLKGTAATTGKYRDIKFLNCIIRAADSTMALIDPSSASSKIRMLKFLGCSFRMGQGAALSFASDYVQGVEVAHCDFDDNNIAAGASGHDIIVRGENVDIHGNRFLTGSAGDACVFIASTATKARVTGNDFTMSTRGTNIDNNAAPSSAFVIRDNVESAAFSVIEQQRSLQTSDGTATVIWTYTLGADEAISIEADVSGWKTTYDAGGSGVTVASYYKDGAAAPAVVTSATAVHSKWSASYSAAFDVSGNAVRVLVTGPAATTVNWMATVRAVLKG